MGRWNTKEARGTRTARRRWEGEDRVCSKLATLASRQPLNPAEVRYMGLEPVCFINRPRRLCHTTHEPLRPYSQARCSGLDDGDLGESAPIYLGTWVPRSNLLHLCAHLKVCPRRRSGGQGEGVEETQTELLPGTDRQDTTR